MNINDYINKIEETRRLLFSTREYMLKVREDMEITLKPEMDECDRMYQELVAMEEDTTIPDKEINEKMEEYDEIYQKMKYYTRLIDFIEYVVYHCEQIEDSAIELGISERFGN